MEFALVAPLFLGLLLAIIEMGVLGMTSAALDNALVVTSRMIRTGQADRPADVGQFRTLVCRNMFGDCASRLTVTVTPVEKYSNAFRPSSAASANGMSPSNPRSDPQDGVFSVGDASQIMLVTARYRWPVFTPFLGDAFRRTANGDVVITNHLLFRNEPYR